MNDDDDVDGDMTSMMMSIRHKGRRPAPTAGDPEIPRAVLPAALRVPSRAEHQRRKRAKTAEHNQTTAWKATGALGNFWMHKCLDLIK